MNKIEIPFVDLKAIPQLLQQEIKAEINRVINDSAFIKGKYVEKFEKEFAEYLGVKYCIGVGNGTDALYIALHVLGIGPGDEVIVPPNTFIATAEAVTMTGAVPVFVECDETYCIDVARIEEKVTRKTRAIIPVHLYGQVCNLLDITEVADEYKLFIVEDCAQAHGVNYFHGVEHKAATWSEVGCFSFFPSKNLGCFGDGGACATDSDRLAEKIRLFANHGGKNRHEFPGINSRLDGIQAAVLSQKLPYLDEFNLQRKAIAEEYNEGLKHVRTPVVKRDHVYHLYVIEMPPTEIIQGKNVAGLKEYLDKKGIQTGLHYPFPIPQTKAYDKGEEEFYQFVQYKVSLPIYPGMTPMQVEYVIENVNNYFEEK